MHGDNGAAWAAYGLVLTFALLQSGASSPARAEEAPVSLRPGQNIQAEIDANPPGTSFSFAPGTYRGADFVPKSGDRFLGSPEVVLDGAVALTGPWVRSNRGDFRLSRLPPPLPVSGKAGAGRPMATHPEDLFVDGVLYVRVASRVVLGPGKWFFDERRRQAFATDNLNARAVELSQSEHAVSGGASDVVLQGFTVTRYAAPAQFGAIVVSGSGWRLRNLTVRQNHGEGVSVFGKGMHIEGGSYSDNGQEGISGYQCDGLVIDDAEIARNNYAGFDMNWQAGGIKIATAFGVTFAGNFVHDNHGMGIWDDAEVSGAMIRGNRVIDNDYNGIMHELSYEAEIVGNRLVRNGTFRGAPVVPAGILLQNSSGVDVHDNYVETRPDTGNGITMTYETPCVNVLGV